MNLQDFKEHAYIEVEHILESGVNSVRLIEMMTRMAKLYATEKVKETLRLVQQHAKVKAVKGDRIEVMKTVAPHFDGWEVSVDAESIAALESEILDNINKEK